MGCVRLKAKIVLIRYFGVCAGIVVQHKHERKELILYWFVYYIYIIMSKFYSEWSYVYTIN